MQASGTFKISDTYPNGEIRISVPGRVDRAADYVHGEAVRRATRTIAPSAIILIDYAGHDRVAPAYTILTPDEVREAQGAAVEEAVTLVNRRLAQGERTIILNAGLEDDVRERLTASGWAIHYREVSPGGGAVVTLGVRKVEPIQASRVEHARCEFCGEKVALIHLRKADGPLAMLCDVEPRANQTTGRETVTP